jgi:hypothetical protein
VDGEERTVRPSSDVSKLSARLGTGFRSSSSLISGSMMLSRMFADVVSLARPGSSDGGSVPQFTVSVCSAAGPPASSCSSCVVPVPAASPPSSSPPQPAATRARLATSMAKSSQRVLILMKCVLPSFAFARAYDKQSHPLVSKVYRAQTRIG